MQDARPELREASLQMQRADPTSGKPTVPTLRRKPKRHAHLLDARTIWKIRTTLVTGLKVHIITSSSVATVSSCSRDSLPGDRYTKEYPMGDSPHPAMIDAIEA